MLDKESRYEYLDSAKGIASIIVVLSHIPVREINDFKFLKNGLDLIFATLHNPTFYFISGFLFKESLKKYDIKFLFKSKLLDTMVVFSIWSVIIFCFYYVSYGWIRALLWKAANTMWFFIPLYIAYMGILLYEKKIFFIKKALITILWFGVFCVMVFVWTVPAKILLYSFIVWIGFNTNFISPKFLGYEIMLYLIFIVILILSNRFYPSEFVSKPGIHNLVFLSLTLLSCRILPEIMIIMDKYRCRTLSYIGKHS